MRTNQHILKFPALLFLLFSFLIPASLIPATAGEVSGDFSETDKISVENRKYVNGALSFDAKLSRTPTNGTLYSAVFAENGRMKRVAPLPAQASCAVSLTDIQPTDSVKVIWTDENHTPIDCLTLRMGENHAKAYAQFTEKLAEAFKRDGQPPAVASDDNPYGLGRLLVSCDTPSDLSGYGADIIPGPDNLYVLQFRTPGEAKQCAETLRALPSVRYAEPDSVMLADAETQETPAAALHSWGVAATAVGEYAEYLSQSGKNRTVVVAVVDSGLDTSHPFFQNRALPGFDFVEYDDIPQDTCGHGTHVAGTVIDCTAGINAQILPVRVLNSFGAGRFLDIALGIRYAADNGADVINLSLSSSTDSVTIDDAIRYAVSKNVAVVAAAGNYNRRADTFCPAHMRECVTVAAVDSDLKRYGKSNYGDAVDIAAPGVGIESCAPGGGYVLNSGTSMAAPHVSAAAALLLCERGSGLTPTQIARLLRDAASELPPDRDEPEKRLGAGFLNMRPFIMRTVSFYSQGRLIETRSVPSGSVVTLKAPDVSRDGYAFTEWNASADGSGVSYPDGATLTVTEDMTLYAQWEEAGGLYALLYADGELTFQKSRVPQEGQTPLKTYPVAVGDADAQHAAWYQERGQIRTVTFADTIQPLSTASWFHGCANLSEICGIERLDASKVTDMSQMFSGCASLVKLDLTAWNVSGVTNMQAAFFACANLAELDLTGWNTTNVTNTDDMFNGCAALKTVYASETFTTDAVSNSAGMFGGCTSLVGGAGTQCDSAHTDKAYARIDGAENPGYFTDKNAPQPGIYAILYGDGELVFQNNNRTESGRAVTDVYKVEGSYSDSDYAPWYGQRDNIKTVTFADKVQPDSTAYWFYYCRKLAEVRNIKNLDTANVTNMGAMFFVCSELTALDVSRFDTVNVTNMGGMFWGCSKLTALDVSRFDTVNVTNMSGMFCGCSELTALDVSRFDTANVTSMSAMFSGCAQLTELDVSRFDTANVTNMNAMFYLCIRLTELDVSRFDTANVTDMSSMFADCARLTELDVSRFDTANVTNMSAMFSDCAQLTELDVSHFDTAKITDMRYMFCDCSNLKTIYVSEKFTTASVINSSDMFRNCASLVGYAGTQYSDDHTDISYARIDGGADNPGYFTLKDDTANLSAQELFYLGQDYSKGQNGKPQDYAKARYYYEKSAAMGNMYAISDLGYMYLFGQGVAVDYAKALERFEQAAGMGNPYSVNNLGYMYENGLGVARDYQKALEYYQKSVDMGNENASINMLNLQLRIALGF